MTLYEETLEMDNTIDFIDSLASKMDERASKVQLQIETLEQLLAVKEYRKTEKHCNQISKWLEQLQKIYEIIESYEDEDIEGKDSIGAFLKIYDVIKKMR